MQENSLARHLPAQQNDPYESFDQLDGSHPWMERVPEGLISYPVRELAGGKVAYFNFDLAMEMGLIPQDHPKKLNRRLERRVLKTFCLRIINEYDKEQGIEFPEETLKKHPYMATRYLQLQHPDKTGRTSGDGRCIWNGQLSGPTGLWDVSSRGTGVTALAPGAVLAGCPLQSGNTDYGYGCGLAEIDELYGAAIMAEIFHRNGLNTERMLCVIDTGDGYGIGVRAGKNLFRPAHLFLYLKQGQYGSLKKSTDYIIEHQFRNKEWTINPRHPRKYEAFLDEVCESFAQFVAQLDRDYIFAWLDWDGDNVLINSGIIDYGSVRQFGLRHDQYRYDDEDRFSTNLGEQKLKAKKIIQSFAQLTDFLNHKEKKPLDAFRRHPILHKFDQHFQYYLLDRFLYQMGLLREQREHLLQHRRKEVDRLFAQFSYFERIKTYKKMSKVADGVNRPAIFNMRRALAEMAHRWSTNSKEPLISERDFFHLILADSASKKDKRLTDRLGVRIRRLQTQYVKVLKLVGKMKQGDSPLSPETFARRAQIINRPDRVTGNALINIVSEIIEFKKKGLRDEDIQQAIDEFTQSQSCHPELFEPNSLGKLHPLRQNHRLMRSILSLVDGYKEDI